jgi:Tfp pilus assembly protein PilF
MLRALLFCDAGQYREAIPLLRKVIALDPQRQQTARYHLSLALARTGQEEEARKVMAEVQWAQAAKRLAGDGHPDNLELQVRVAEAQLGAGRSEEALRLLEAVLARDPDYAAAHRLLASYYEEQGQAARATEHRCRAER